MLKAPLLPLRAALALLLLFSLPLQASSLARDVDLRIETFDEIDRIFKEMRFKVVHLRSEDREGNLAYAEKLVTLAYRLPGLFESYSSGEKFPQSRAHPRIWSQKDKEGFWERWRWSGQPSHSEQLNLFIDRLEKIHELLEQGDMTGAAAAIDRTAQSCRQCHNTFRYR